MPGKGLDRPATGRTFVAIIVVACLASVLVILWTMHSLSDRQKEHAAPAEFRI
jgi:hypothetical protein